jgi:hypothetical protein
MPSVRVQTPPPQARIAEPVRIDARDPLEDELAHAEPARHKAR